MLYSFRKDQRNFMKKSSIFILSVASILLLVSCGEETKESVKKGIDTPVDKYMDSRVNAMDMAKQSVKKTNRRIEEENKAMKALLEK